VAWRTGEVGKTVSSLKLMATDPGWMDRQAYVQICGAFSSVVDPKVVIEELVPLLVMTADDAVPNVRRELAVTIATLQANPSFATLPDLRDAVARLRVDRDADVAQTARECAFEDRGGMGRACSEFAPTGLRSPLR
jgi:serine/threonine-protein phosphatase 4 regulatory subunit 1